MLNMVAKEFDIDRNSGAITTALELYNLPPPQENIASLKQWRDKVRYIMNQISASDQPEPRLLAKWLYDRLRKHPSMRRHIDRIRDSEANSDLRTFEWLWGQLEKAIMESQMEANAVAIQEQLRRGPAKLKAKEETSGMPGKAAGKDNKGKKKEDDKGKGKEKGKEKGKGHEKSKKEGKGNSNQENPKRAMSELTPAQKAEMPCIYFAQNKCFREKCPFKHDPAAQAKAEPKPKADPKPKVAPKPGLVALVAATISAATATTVQSGHQPEFLEFVGDTGAGEWLGSREALVKQGVSCSVLDSVIGSTQHPLRFTTGGGTQPSQETVGMWSQEFQRVSNMYLLPSCPLVISIGQLVEQEGYSFHWTPNALPFLSHPSGTFLEAHRIEHHVPVFRLSCDMQYGLPVIPTKGGVT